MDDQTLDLNTQKLILRAKVLIVLAIAISLFFIIPILIDTFTYNDILFAIQWVTFWVGVIEVLFLVFTLFIILLKKERRIQSMIACFIFISFFIMITDVIYLFISPQFRTYPFVFIMEIIEVILFCAFYQKTKGKRPAPKLAYGLFITWILLFVVFIFVNILYMQDFPFRYAIFKHDYSVIFFAIFSLLMQYFAPFVLCWIAFISVKNEGFYEGFIEAPNKEVQEIEASTDDRT